MNSFELRLRSGVRPWMGLYWRYVRAVNDVVRVESGVSGSSRQRELIDSAVVSQRCNSSMRV
jgi:hypothetical protein